MERERGEEEGKRREEEGVTRELERGVKGERSEGRDE